MGFIARLLKIETNDDKEMIQTVERHYKENKYCEQFAMSGDDSPPLEDDRVLLSDVEGAGHAVSLGVLSHSEGAEPGERILFSREKEEKKLVAKLYLKKDGGIELVSLDKDNDFKEAAKLIFSKDGKIQLSSIKDGEVKASVNLDADGNFSFNGKSDSKLEIEGGMKITVKGDAEIEAQTVTVKGKTKVTQGSFECGGTVAPSGQGALCGVPYCLYSGAPQTGNLSQGT